MNANEIKMYISTLTIGKNECGDFLGHREDLNSMKSAIYMYFFASIIRKDKGYKSMAFTLTACSSFVHYNNMEEEVVCKITYKDMINIIKAGYRSPLFDTSKQKLIVDIRLKELKLS